MTSSIINGLLRDWGTDPLFILTVAALPMLWLALRARLNSAEKTASWPGRYRIWSRLSALLWLGCILLFSAPALVNPRVDALEQQFPYDLSCSENTPIVLLGAGVHKKAQSADDVEYLHGPAHVRAAHAAKLATQHTSAAVIVAGAGLYDVSEASMMRQYLVQRGVAAGRIVAESASRNTRENAENIARYIEAQNWPVEIRLVTSAMHMPRAMRVFRAQGLEPCAAPVDYLALQNVPWYVLAPQTSALLKFDKYLHELIGSWVYERRGWFDRAS